MKSKPRSPETFFYPGGNTGLLLLHGYTGSTAEMQPMGRYFHNLGYTVHAPLLSGHGKTPEEMAKTRWPDWWQSALDGYDRLVEAGCEKIAVAGLSMGGLLTMRLSYHRSPEAVALLNTPVEVRDKRIKWAKYVHYFKPYIPRRERKEDHIESGLFPYDRNPVACAGSLWDLLKDTKKNLFRVTAPTLIVQSTNDETIEPASADYIYSNIGSEYKEMKWYSNSGHIITLDREREHVFKEVADFLAGIIGKK
ncbi:alpha/beta hydrolase [Aneurinibacillus tyrosinisolvens]|uniref:alpha/beta hydrolase n=1 Tax=Aneurinibacillus tyrosinisolvens TaxID=1443435 RepID=UPI00063F253B|nr:alpha/beta fold hydrolase [Aneurinibacillus tyrosinisolvens]